MSKKKLLIIMSNSDPAIPEGCYAPLFQATIAAALSHDVEVVFTGISGQLAISDNAEKAEVNFESHRSFMTLSKKHMRQVSHLKPVILHWKWLVKI